jgi:hypothetical protein
LSSAVAATASATNSSAIQRALIVTATYCERFPNLLDLADHPVPDDLADHLVPDEPAQRPELEPLDSDMVVRTGASFQLR